MTILDVVKKAVTSIGLEVPEQVFGSTERVWVEMQAMINRAAEMIRDEYDWQALQKTGTAAGDGSATDFALPSDYQRMPKVASVWASTTPNWPAERVLSANEWLEITTRGLPNPYGQWALFGKRLRYRPTLPIGATASFVYLTKNIVTPATGADKPLFTADDDTFVLSDRLLELAIIYRWKSSKNQAYAAELDDYESALLIEMDNDKGAKPVLDGNGPCFDRVKLAFPYTVTEAS